MEGGGRRDGERKGGRKGREGKMGLCGLSPDWPKTSKRDQPIQTIQTSVVCALLFWCGVVVCGWLDGWIHGWIDIACGVSMIQK